MRVGSGVRVGGGVAVRGPGVEAGDSDNLPVKVGSRPISVAATAKPTFVTCRPLGVSSTLEVLTPMILPFVSTSARHYYLG